MSTQPKELAVLARIVNDLATIDNIGECKAIRDKVEAIRAYTKKQGYELEIQNEAAEAKVRTERRLGQLLKGADRRKPEQGRPKKVLHGATHTPSLSSLGIERTQSHRWQRIAALPEEKFEGCIKETKGTSKELTSAVMLSRAKAHANGQRNAKANEDGETGSTGSLESLIASGAQYGTILADPPWQYGNQATRASTDNHYGTMPLDAICSLPVAKLAAKQSHLHLWTTNAFLFDAKRVMEAWGFEYKSVFVWVKPQMGIGNYWRVSHEFMLLGVRGGLTFSNRAQMSWKSADRSKHSQKPECIRNIVEKVSPSPRLELFGRKMVHGWTVWGNQIERSLYAG